jgi:enoyl-CoA hydratase/carnithine racemase
MKRNMAEVLFEREGPIAWLRMNRPEVHNAVSREMMALMADRVHELASDRDALVAILCGNGPSFCTGLDVKELARGALEAEFFVDWNRMMRSLRELPIPLIAAIHGHCLGGGTMLTLEADYRLASDDLHIGLGALRLGILPGSAPEVLPAIVGAATARRLCLFAEYVDADEALRINLVDRVVPRAELDATARELADRVLGFSAAALRECKSLLATAGTLDADGYERAFREAQQRCLDDVDPG